MWPKAKQLYELCHMQSMARGSRGGGRERNRETKRERLQCGKCGGLLICTNVLTQTAQMQTSISVQLALTLSLSLALALLSHSALRLCYAMEHGIYIYSD